MHREARTTKTFEFCVCHMLGNVRCSTVLCGRLSFCYMFVSLETVAAMFTLRLVVFIS